MLRPGAPTPFAKPERASLQPVPAEEIQVKHGEFNSARTCGSCHRMIYSRWQHGMHAMSYDDPIFLEAFERAYLRSGGEAASYCLGCHSPTTRQTKDYAGNLPLTHEGVTCDFCHTVGGVDLDAADPFLISLGEVRYGPLRHASSPVHKVEYRGHFEGADLCAGCHELKSPKGGHLLSTYSEWKESRYAAENKPCQSCHMPALKGPTVDPAAAGVHGREVYNEHDLAGGHEPEQIRQAISLRIESMEREGEDLQLVVSVSNTSAGHKVPTGHPLRKLVLSVVVSGRGRTLFERRQEYRKVVVDEDGKVLTEDWEVKWKGARILSDNRIHPGETRRETFHFDTGKALEGEAMTAEAALTYEYSPQIRSPQPLEVEIGMVSELLPKGRSTPAGPSRGAGR